MDWNLGSEDANQINVHCVSTKLSVIIIIPVPWLSSCCVVCGSLVFDMLAFVALGVEFPYFEVRTTPVMYINVCRIEIMCDVYLEYFIPIKAR